MNDADLDAYEAWLRSQACKPPTPDLFRDCADAIKELRAEVSRLHHVERRWNFIAQELVHVTPESRKAWHGKLYTLEWQGVGIFGCDESLEAVFDREMTADGEVK
jgi:hypothetical protein